VKKFHARHASLFYVKARKVYNTQGIILRVIAPLRLYEKSAEGLTAAVVRLQTSIDESFIFKQLLSKNFMSKLR